MSRYGCDVVMYGYMKVCLYQACLPGCGVEHTSCVCGMQMRMYIHVSECIHTSVDVCVPLCGGGVSVDGCVDVRL